MVACMAKTCSKAEILQTEILYRQICFGQNRLVEGSLTGQKGGKVWPHRLKIYNQVLPFDSGNLNRMSHSSILPKSLLSSLIHLSK